MSTTHTPPNPRYADAIRAVLTTMPAARSLGFVIASIDAGSVELRQSIRPELTEHTGHVQAGILGSLADFAAGASAGTLLPEGWVNVTLDYTIKLVAPVGGDEVIARGRVVSSGKTVSVAAADLLDESGRVCATGLATFRNVRIPQDRG
ncbi:PaaI family thioesterase [Tsukamurella sp. 8F]|uniref:PaaI family thioesterase n=1 Tax=unclassified Tsukamurella TaxID=2633480 RepID=UPI0023BA2F4F|nr:MULTISPECIES: PaaI family thioesterase [unclassified Tsukamurella]MDF0529490.1 PaaI family thioesterase [Tsukamurella sp. 8J]MDF0585822.1 PaaI family thioesterase [Tsukamurella sp. 8F]